MKGTILERIVEAKRERVKAAKALTSEVELRETAIRRREGRRRRLRAALAGTNGTNIIAEFKRASPSKGPIAERADAAEVAKAYASGGAAAISVLTEEDHFHGSMDDLRTVRSAVDLPILRKDFVFDPFQIYEAAASGADAVLLIAAMLDDRDLACLRGIAENELGMDALMEVHDLAELERVKRLGATLIGVNNRDLRTFEVSLNVSRTLIEYAPPEAVMVAESGLNTVAEVNELRRIGYKGFLIGEMFMRDTEPARRIREMANAG